MLSVQERNPPASGTQTPVERDVVPDMSRVSSTRIPIRRSSSASHVPIDYFDPKGMDELRRTYTAQSIAARSVHPQHPLGQISDESTPVSETAVTDQDKFDLEQILKDAVRRYASLTITLRKCGPVLTGV